MFRTATATATILVCGGILGAQTATPYTGQVAADSVYVTDTSTILSPNANWNLHVIWHHANPYHPDSHEVGKNSQSFDFKRKGWQTPGRFLYGAGDIADFGHGDVTQKLQGQVYAIRVSPFYGSLFVRLQAGLQFSQC